MDEFGCDYASGTVGEGIVNNNIPEDWYAEFDVYDDVYPIICIQVKQIINIPAMMKLKIRIIDNKADEYAGCMVFKETNTIAFKIDYMSDLVNAANKMGAEKDLGVL